MTPQLLVGDRMSDNRQQPENPFPFRAVATFGTPLDAEVTFQFMRRTRDEFLYRYLREYPRRATLDGGGGGGALGLIGGNGSGKTFLLAWLSAEAAKIPSLPSQCLYAKADNVRFADLYKQVLRNIDRQSLNAVVRHALERLAKARSDAALATEATSREIDRGRPLERLIEEKKVDIDELYIELKQRIAGVGNASALAGRVAEAVGLLEDPELGDTAFNWIGGSDIEGAPRAPLFRTPLWGHASNQSSEDVADVAINALECMSALYRLAGIPLVILVDQMENFFATDDLGPSQSSVIKKFVEQIGRQSAYVFLAGTLLAWERFPRDVGPRFVSRDPLPVGNLTNDEVELLISAYLKPHGLSNQSFSNDIVETIRGVSGGNPREILRIANRAFDKANGRLDQVDINIIFDSARESGTIDDRKNLALSYIDKVLTRLRYTWQTVRLPGDVAIERWAVSPSGKSIAIALAVATDPVSEVGAAERLAATRSKLSELPSRPELLAVAVGYTSDRIRKLLEIISSIIVFEELTVEDELEKAIGTIALTTDPLEPPNADGQSDQVSALAEQLAKLLHRLDDVGTSRLERQEDAGQALARGATILEASYQKTTSAKTRWDLVEGLDELRRSLSAGDLWEERRIMRSLLVANDAYLKDSAFDYLGGIYLDAIDEEETERIGLISGNLGELRNEYHQLRSRVIRAMRSQCMRQRQNLLFSQEIASVVGGSLLIALLGVIGILVYNNSASNSYPKGAGVDLSTAAIIVASLAAIAAVSVFYIDSVLRQPNQRFMNLRRDLSKIREKTKSQEVGEG
jgi:hypothetical protein